MSSIKKLKEIINKSYYEYNHENPEQLRSKEFSKAYKAYIKKQIAPYNYELVNFSDGYCECSGFVTNGQKYVYFNSGDYRMSASYSDIFDRVLVRTANDERDYRGGFNQFCPLEQIGKKINELMESDRY